MNWRGRRGMRCTAKAMRDAARYFRSDVGSHRCYCAIDKARYWTMLPDHRPERLPQIKNIATIPTTQLRTRSQRWGKKVLLYA